MNVNNKPASLLFLFFFSFFFFFFLFFFLFSLLFPCCWAFVRLHLNRKCFMQMLMTKKCPLVGRPIFFCCCFASKIYQVSCLYLWPNSGLCCDLSMLWRISSSCISWSSKSTHTHRTLPVIFMVMARVMFCVRDVAQG